MDGTSKRFETDPFTNAGELLGFIEDTLNLKEAREEFAIYEVIKKIFFFFFQNFFFDFIIFFRSLDFMRGL